MKRLIAATLALTLVAAGCSDDDRAEPAPGKLRVLAGSELADLKPVLDKAAEATGVRVEFTFTGTIEGAEQVASGAAAASFDAVWFSADRYLRTLPGADGKLGNQAKIMSSPVVLGVAASKARELGWQDKAVTWSDIAAAADAKRFTYGMTDPSASNSGFSALVAVSSALAGTGNAITADQIATVTPALKRFFGAQALSAGSSGWLSDAYRKRATGEDPGRRVDGLVNYESVLLSLNASGGLPEPLTLIHPTDGVVTADYPLTLLAGAGDHARGDHQRLAEYLRGEDAQRHIMETTKRRPVTPNVPLPAEFGAKTLVELPFPGTKAAVEGLLSAYFDTIRRPSRTFYVLDTSGSMSGDRIKGLRRALVELTGATDDPTGRYRRFRGREEVTLLPFNGKPGSPATFTIPETDQQPELDRVRAYAGTLQDGGGTAIYDSLLTAYRLAESGASEDRFTSIVLMTDGENTSGAGIAAFTAAHSGFPAHLREVPVFTVLFGEGSQSEMDTVARSTGGKVFDARSTELAAVFREIRGYQ